MNAIVHLFGLGCLIIVGRALPGLVVEGLRRIAMAPRKVSAALRPASPQVPVMSPSPDLSLEHNS